jgi:hypothetical protein
MSSRNILKKFASNDKTIWWGWWMKVVIVGKGARSTLALQYGQKEE